MTLDEQVRIMEAHLEHFDTLMEKMMYLKNFFGPDPEFTEEAIDTVRHNIARNLPR